MSRTLRDEQVQTEGKTVEPIRVLKERERTEEPALDFWDSLVQRGARSERFDLDWERQQRYA